MPRKKRPPSLEMAARLDAVRTRAGITQLTEFRRRLVEGGDYEVSYQAVQNYHFDRPAPIEYLARVAEVFGADFTYLATGKQPEPRITLRISGGPGEAKRESGRQHLRVLEGLVDRIERPSKGARFLLPDPYLIARDIRTRAGRADVLELIRSWRNEDAKPEDLEQHIRDTLALYERLDDVLRSTWQGMRKIVAHEYGTESVERLTFEQQIRFRDAMLLALSCLFPDHGDPASFKERRVAEEEES